MIHLHKRGGETTWCGYPDSNGWPFSILHEQVFETLTPPEACDGCLRAYKASR